MDVENHVACMVADDGIGMGGSVVKEVCKCLGSGFVPLTWEDVRVPRATSMVESTAQP